MFVSVNTFDINYNKNLRINTVIKYIYDCQFDIFGGFLLVFINLKILSIVNMQLNYFFILGSYKFG